MAKRRGNGEGSVYYHEPSQRWTGQATVGWDPFTRKVKRVTVYADTQKEARERLAEARREALQPRTDQTVGVALDYWLAGHKSRVDPRTVAAYEYEVEPIREYLGRRRLDGLTPQDVEALYLWMSEKGASADRVHRAGKRLRQCLAKCVKAGFLATSPAARTDLPRVRPREVTPLTAEQARRLLLTAEGRPYESLYHLALDAGARVGELLALTWGDVDLGPSPEVFFNKSLQDLNGQLRVKTTKTPKGRRRVPITRRTADRVLAAGPGAPSDLIYTARSGEPVRPSNLNRRYWQPLLKAAGLEGTRFHDLRHTCATLLLLANVHPKVVSERLGHSKIEITLNTYSHLLPTMQTQAVAALEAALAPVQ